jgi:hypothetical protein
MASQIQSAERKREPSRQRAPAKPAARGPVALAPAPDPALLQRAIADPRAASPRDILALQRLAGNRAVTRLIQSSGKLRVQAKLTVGPAGDKYEQEADRVADQVVSGQPSHREASLSAVSGQQSAVSRQAEEEEEVQTKPLAASITPLVQRQAEEEDEEEVQAKPIVQRQAEEEEEVQTKPVVQRQAEDEEEEEVQTKSNLPRPAGAGQGGQPLTSNFQAGFEAGPDIESRLAAHKGGGSPLPDDVRAAMEPRFGADFSGVRVHTGGEADQLNRQLSAQAFTHGQDIYMGAGKYDPTSNDGKKLLAHELTHVVQQNDSTVRRHSEATAPARAGTTTLNIGQRDESGIQVIRRRNDLEVVAEYQGHQAVGKNGHEDETREAIADKRPRLYNSLESVPEPLDRSKFACAEANALGNLLRVVPVPTQNYRDIAFGPAKFTKNMTLGEGVATRFFPKGSNYQRCRNCQQWLAPPDFDKITPLR